MRYAQVVATLLLLSGTSRASHMIGTIKFPEMVSSIPGIRVYCGGCILPTDIDQKCKEVSFSFPCKINQRSFVLVVSDHIQPVYEPASKNTVQYLRVTAADAYKAYQLVLTPQTTDQDGKQIMSYSWTIHPITLPEPERRLPDSALIVFFPSHSVEGFCEGGTTFALPTLAIKPDIIQLIGSPEQFKELSTKLLLACLDVDTLHTVVPPYIKHIEDKGRTLIIPTV